MKITKAVILAGGLGTRMAPITKVFPKEMLPIVNKPLLAYIVDDLQSCGIKDVLIVSHKDKTSIQNYFENGKTHFSFVYPNKPNGVVDAIMHAKSFTQNSDFVLIFGDVLFSNGYSGVKQMLNTYEKTNKSVVGCFNVGEKEKSLYGIIENKKARSSYIYNIIEKPKQHETKSNLAIAGTYILKNEIFLILNNKKLFTDALQALFDNKTLAVKKIRGEYFDVGSQIGYIKASIYFALKDKNTKNDINNYIKEVLKKP